MYRYTKVAAQKLTKTVIETAIAGGGGLVDTLRHSYSMNDLQGGTHSGQGQYDMYHREDQGDGRIMPQSWHEGRRYDTFEDPDSPVETRAIRGRRKPQTGSLLALTSENDLNEPRQETRRRRVGSVRHKEPTSSSLPRSGAIYGTLPRKPRKPRSPAPDLQPLVRRSTVSKENISLEESDGEAQAKHRALSASPVRKVVKKKPPNSLDIIYSKNQPVNMKPRPLRTRRKNASNKNLPKETEEEEKEATDNKSEDTFSMTYSEEEKRESRKKCEIS